MKSKSTHADLAGSRYLALQRFARAQNRATAELLQLYVLESFLRRLVRSQHDRALVLKGGMLLAAFDLRRATRDVDVLALQADNDPAAVRRVIADVTSVEVDDGVEFLQDTITAVVIRDDDVYPGVRASLEAHLATARLKLSVDFNVGDPVIPAPIRAPGSTKPRHSSLANGSRRRRSEGNWQRDETFLRRWRASCWPIGMRAGTGRPSALG